MIHHWTLQQMRLFEAVARLRSYTRAAQELHLTQPAVHIQVKRLEESMGLPLIESVGKKLLLTHAGAISHEQMESRTGELYLKFDQDRKRQEAIQADQQDEADFQALEAKLKRRPKQ